jgi:class 3 adenylate cyclase
VLGGSVSDLPATQYARSADGTRLAYQVVGEGLVDLVFMPWDRPVDLLWDEPAAVRVRKRLSGFSRTIFFDVRGSGSSEGNPLDGAIGERFAEDVHAVLDAVGSERAVLLCGGTLGPGAIAFVATHPQRVVALVLCNTFAHYVRDADYPCGIPAHALDRIVAQVTSAWGTGAQLDLLAPSRSTDDRLRTQWARNQRLGVGAGKQANVMRARLEADARPFLAAVRVPTLVLHREGNRFIRIGAGRYIADHIDGATFVALPGDDHLLFTGDSDALVDEIEEFLTGTHQGPEGDVVTAAVLFTDIVASTEQSARVGHRHWTALLDAHNAMVRASLDRYRGREIKTIGDGFLATFDATTRAVRAAIEIVAHAQQASLDVRAGVHSGDIEILPDDVAGLAVTIAKRVCDLADPGTVLVSETVKGQLVGTGITTSPHGTHTLKGVPDQWHLYTVTTPPPTGHFDPPGRSTTPPASDDR